MRCVLCNWVQFVFIESESVFEDIDTGKWGVDIACFSNEDFFQRQQWKETQLQLLFLFVVRMSSPILPISRHVKDASQIAK